MASAAIEKNLKLFNWDRLFLGFAPLRIFLVLYFEQLTGSIALAMSIFTIQSLIAASLEIPTGMLSDHISRKKLLITYPVCFLLAYVCWIVAYYHYSYALLVVGAAFWGLATSISTGTFEAFVYETCREAKVKYHEIFARMQTWRKFMSGSTAVLGGIVAYFFGYVYCAWGTVFAMTVLTIISCFYVEPKTKKIEKKQTFWQETKAVFTHFKNTKPLKVLLAPCFLNVGISDAAERFENKFFAGFVGEWLLGIVRLLREWSMMLGFYFSKSIIAKLGFKTTIIGAQSGVFIVQFAALLLNSVLTPFLLVSTRFFTGISDTVKNQLLQDHYLDKHRATMESLISIGNSLSIAIFAFLIGIVAESVSPLAAMMMTVCLRPISVIIYAYLFKIMPKNKNYEKVSG